MRQIDTIILHHTDGHQGGEGIRRDHLTRGWSDIFYHFVIETSGKVFPGRELARHAGRRRSAIEIALVGRLHLENMTELQGRSLRAVIVEMREKFPTIINFYNHKDLARTICPGNIDIKDFLEEGISILKTFLEGGDKMQRFEFDELKARVTELENNVIELYNWRADLRAFVHGTIMPEVRFAQRVRQILSGGEIPDKKEGTE